MKLTWAIKQSMIEAVLWDFGGVMTSSPFEAFNRYESANDLPMDCIRTINSTNPDTNAWAQLENNHISVDEFDLKFAQEAKEHGHSIPGSDVLALLSGDLRPEMVAALKIIKKRLKWDVSPTICALVRAPQWQKTRREQHRWMKCWESLTW